MFKWQANELCIFFFLFCFVLFRMKAEHVCFAPNIAELLWKLHIADQLPGRDKDLTTITSVIIASSRAALVTGCALLSNLATVCMTLT
jgi:hypothetical protein